MSIEIELARVIDAEKKVCRKTIENYKEDGSILITMVEEPLTESYTEPIDRVTALEERVSALERMVIKLKGGGDIKDATI